MDTPKWLKGPIADLRAQETAGDIKRDVAVAKLIKMAQERDEGLLLAIHEEWFGSRMQAAENADIREGRARALAAAMADAPEQPSFDEVEPTFLPDVLMAVVRLCKGRRPRLSDGWAFHKKQKEMTKNFSGRDKERERDLAGMDLAVGGDQDADLADAYLKYRKGVIDSQGEASQE